VRDEVRVARAIIGSRGNKASVRWCREAGLDETGEDYLYEAGWFALVDFPEAVDERALAQVVDAVARTDIISL
jgi:hypothetical protein